MQPNNQIQTIVPMLPVDSKYTLFASLTPQEGWEQRKQSFQVDCDEQETEEEDGKKEEPKKRQYCLERQKAFRNIKEAQPALVTAYTVAPMSLCTLGTLVQRDFESSFKI